MIVDYGGVLAIVPAVQDPIRRGRGLLQDLNGLTGELGAAAVETALRDTENQACRLLLSIINLGKVLYITERRGAFTGPRKSWGSSGICPSRSCRRMSTAGLPAPG